MRGIAILFMIGISALGQKYNPIAKERGPESITQLPPGVRQDLVNRKCLVPKYRGRTSSEDGAYTTGHFRSNGSTDFAVVCDIPACKLQDVLVYSLLNGAWTGEVISHG